MYPGMTNHSQWYIINVQSRSDTAFWKVLALIVNKQFLHIFTQHCLHPLRLHFFIPTIVTSIDLCLHNRWCLLNAILELWNALWVYEAAMFDVSMVRVVAMLYPLLFAPSLLTFGRRWHTLLHWRSWSLPRTAVIHILQGPQTFVMGEHLKLREVRTFQQTWAWSPTTSNTSFCPCRKGQSCSHCL